MAELAKEVRAWEMLCARLGRDPKASEESDTCTLRAAWKAMLTFSDQEAASPTLLEALVELEQRADEVVAALDKYNAENGTHLGGPPFFKIGVALAKARAAITLATGEA